MKIKLTVDGYQCEKCGHKWLPHKKSSYPVTCPKCRTPYWDQPRKNKRSILSIKGKKEVEGK